MNLQHIKIASPDHCKFISTAFITDENGGLVDDSLFQVTNQDPLTYAVHMTDASATVLVVNCFVG